MISLNWVKDYIDISNIDPQELATRITQAGINIEKVITNNINNLVIGKVTSCINHPDSDHLHICTVDIGSNEIQIVCGAKNVKEGIKVIVALPGSILPGNFEIKKGVIRGVESNGMICALFELGLEEKNEITYNKGIHILNDDAKIGGNPLEFLGVNDTLFELDVHKHRNNDCYYHIGFAYEIASIINGKVSLPKCTYNEDKDNVNNYLKLEVKTDKCSLYTAKMVTNVKIKESPDFIQKRLNAVGLRSINNVVDISNYVMLEYGQPLHFFDKDKVGNNIVVRNANEKESIITLDNTERLLNSNDIVITDSNKSIAIAGVMGGLDTSITESTKNILIESAIFDAISIRNTSNRLNLKSDASVRYGKGLNYEYTYNALDRACELLEKYADATILSGSVIYDKVDKTKKEVEFVPSNVNKLLGITISESNMEVELNRLGFEYIIKDNKFKVIIPNRRLDIEPNVNDIAEEIGRLYGYHNLISTLPKVSIKQGEYKGNTKYIKLISKRLRSLGLNEVKTYTLISPKMNELFRYQDLDNVILPNSMSIDKSIIRNTVLPSLINVYNYNVSRKVEDILIYEISKTYDKNYNEDIKISILMKGNYIENKVEKNNIKVDFYLIKGIIENILEYLGYRNRYSFIGEVISNLHPGISAKITLDKDNIGIIGRVHPSLSKEDIYVAEISLTKIIRDVKPIKYKASSIYPTVTKDLAFIVDKEINADYLINQIKRSASRLLTNIDIFDVYMGSNIEKNKKSIAFTLTFSSDTNTLTDNDINVILDNIIKDMSNKFNAILRDN